MLVKSHRGEAVPEPPLFSTTSASLQALLSSSNVSNCRYLNDLLKCPSSAWSTVLPTLLAQPTFPPGLLRKGPKTQPLPAFHLLPTPLATLCLFVSLLTSSLPDGLVRPGLLGLLCILSAQHSVGHKGDTRSTVARRMSQ